MQEMTWPVAPLIPADWTDESPWQPLVVTRISEGFCPKELTPLSADGYCLRCDGFFELVNSADTASTTSIGPGVFPPWAIDCDNIVQVAREPNWGCPGSPVQPDQTRPPAS